MITTTTFFFHFTLYFLFRNKTQEYKRVQNDIIYKSVHHSTLHTRKKVQKAKEIINKALLQTFFPLFWLLSSIVILFFVKKVRACMPSSSSFHTLHTSLSSSLLSPSSSLSRHHLVFFLTQVVILKYFLSFFFHLPVSQVIIFTLPIIFLSTFVKEWEFFFSLLFLNTHTYYYTWLQQMTWFFFL